MREIDDYRTRIALTRTGIPVAQANDTMDTWSIPVARFAAILGCSERTWGRLRSEDDQTLLGTVESDRLLRLDAVLTHAESVFDTHVDAVTWLTLPNPALNGDSPLSLLDTDTGVQHVETVLTRLEFGVFG